MYDPLLRCQEHDDENCIECATVRIRELEDQTEKLSNLIQGFTGEVIRAHQHRMHAGKGGQQVPFHGDFASAPPSTMSRLRWWAREMRSLLWFDNRDLA